LLEEEEVVMYTRSAKSVDEGRAGRSPRNAGSERVRRILLGALAVMAGAGLVAAPTAHADVLTRLTLDTVLFNDGTTATGSFVFDSTNNTLSDISIVTEASPAFPAGTFTGSIGSNVNSVNISGFIFYSFNFLDEFGLNEYQLTLSPGAPFSFDSQNFIIDPSYELGNNTGTKRLAPSGSLDPSGVAEPAGLTLLAVGLAALAFARSGLAGRTGPRGCEKA
jgi:hypothetical protein